MQNTLSLPAATQKRSSSLYGSISNRFVAFLVDTTILCFIYTLILYPLADNPQALEGWTLDIKHNGINLAHLIFICKALFFNYYLLIIHWLYYTLLEASPKQATIGKFSLGMKVTELRGKRINILTANLRYFSKVFSVITFGLGLFLMLKSRRGQMLHDYIAKTVVVTDH
jgi:uncharacterized RDD family membrane protein YckC